ncbi:MAG: GNAT family N-acetyltransferase [Phycisphaeraceae bacterium]|nr:GNAT family N-acetyltransferase [Phycisphaeraceae bacterium]
MTSFFASVETAQQLERAECALLREVTDVIAAKRDGVELIPIAGGLAVYAGEGAPMNKVAGLGFEGPPTDDEMSRVESLFHRNGARVQVELCTLAEIGVGEMLTRRGYVLAGIENTLICRPQIVEPGGPVGGIEVDEAPDFETWLDVFVEGFLHPDAQGVEAPEAFEREALRSVIKDMSACPTMRHFIARRDGVPVGGADMRLGGGTATLCGASTLPAHRRMGVQTALLRHRIDAARRAGCDLLAVSALPGSKSHQNLQKQGFELAYSKLVLTLDPA